jgi:putative thioredoxin
MEAVQRSFETNVIKASYVKPVVVDFWAPWCGPCRMLGPALEKLARASGGAWRLVKINVDAYPELAGAYGVQGIPAVKLFYRGAVISEFTGAIPGAMVTQWLDAHLPSVSR